MSCINNKIKHSRGTYWSFQSSNKDVKRRGKKAIKNLICLNEWIENCFRSAKQKMSPQLLTLVIQLLLLFTPAPTTVTSHYNYNFTSTSPPSQSEWRPARATFYAASDPRDKVGGACGYGDLEKAGYGQATAGLSEILFERGQICGACFELRCVEDIRWCIPGTSIIVTVTNFCAPNYGFNPDGGGHCNPPNKHFVLPIEAFEKIAIWKAGNMPVQYRRYNFILILSPAFN